MGDNVFAQHPAMGAAQRAAKKATSQPAMDITSKTSPRQAPSTSEASSRAAQIQSSADSTLQTDDRAAQAGFLQRGGRFVGLFA